MVDREEWREFNEFLEMIDTSLVSRNSGPVLTLKPFASPRLPMAWKDADTWIREDEILGRKEYSGVWTVEKGGKYESQLTIQKSQLHHHHHACPNATIIGLIANLKCLLHLDAKYQPMNEAIDNKTQSSPLILSSNPIVDRL